MVSLIITNSSTPLLLPAYLCACHPFHYLSLPSFLFLFWLLHVWYLAYKMMARRALGCWNSGRIRGGRSKQVSVRHSSTLPLFIHHGKRCFSHARVMLHQWQGQQLLQLHSDVASKWNSIASETHGWGDVSVYFCVWGNFPALCYFRSLLKVSNQFLHWWTLAEHCIWRDTIICLCSGVHAPWLGVWSIGSAEQSIIWHQKAIEVEQKTKIGVER